MAEPIPLSARRVERVENVLAHAQALQPYWRPGSDNRPVAEAAADVRGDFKREVVSALALGVTRSLCAEGREVFLVTRNVILRAAGHYLGLNGAALEALGGGPTPRAKFSAPAPEPRQVRRVAQILHRSSAHDFLDLNGVTLDLPEHPAVSLDAVRVALALHHAGQDPHVVRREEVYAVAERLLDRRPIQRVNSKEPVPELALAVGRRYRPEGIVSEPGGRLLEVFEEGRLVPAPPPEPTTPRANAASRVADLTRPLQDDLSEAQIERVRLALADHPEYGARIARRDMPVQRPGGGVTHHNREVIALAGVFLERRYDPTALTSAKILKVAQAFFRHADAATLPKGPPAARPATPSPSPSPRRPSHALGIYTLLLSAVQLAQSDRTEGAAERAAKLAETMSLYQPAANQFL